MDSRKLQILLLCPLTKKLEMIGICIFTIDEQASWSLLSVGTLCVKVIDTGGNDTHFRVFVLMFCLDNMGTLAT